ncbi:hypothetical protein IID04_06755 [PVC group bacterium]|nr:hypothetical protein [PVC group bacterium]
MNRNMELTLIFLFVVMGPCCVYAVSCFTSILSLGRNPDRAPKIFMALVIGLTVVQIIAMAGVLIAYQTYLPNETALTQ